MPTPPYDLEESKPQELAEADAVKLIEAQSIITNTTSVGVVDVLTPAYPTYEAKQRMLKLAKGVTQ